MQNAPDQQVMNDAYDHALWLRHCQSPLDQRDRMLCDLGHYVTQLLAALEKGQENCDAVYNDLRRECDAARAESAELRKERVTPAPVETVTVGQLVLKICQLGIPVSATIKTAEGNSWRAAQYMSFCRTTNEVSIW